MTLSRLLTAVGVWLTLGVLMIFWVFTRHPDPEVLAVCLLAWCGGIAFAVVVWAVDRRRRSGPATRTQ